MRAVAARRERGAVITEVKLSFCVGKSVNVKSVCVQTRCQIIVRDEIYNGRETRFGTNFQQALNDFQWSKASNRVSVSCHDFQRLSFVNVGDPSNALGRPPLHPLGCTPIIW